MRALVLIAALTLASPAWAEGLADQRHIAVSGQAFAKLAPDQATLSVTVQTEDKQLAKAKENNDRQLKKALSVAKDFGLTDKQIQLSQSSIAPQYDYQKDTSRPVFRSYIVSLSMNFTLKEPEKASLLIDALTKQGIDQMGGLSFGLADEKKARDALLEKALEDARSKASRMAAALGAKLGKPLSISESGGFVSPQPPRPMMARFDAASAKMESSPAIPGGEIEVNQQVQVMFALE